MKRFIEIDAIGMGKVLINVDHIVCVTTFMKDTRVYLSPDTDDFFSTKETYRQVCEKIYEATYNVK